VDIQALKALLERVQGGELPIEDAVRDLRHMPFSELGYATVDHHRALRQGVPEVIFGEGKSAAQIIGIAKELARTGQNVLITRLADDKAKLVKAGIPELVYAEAARIGTIEQQAIKLRNEVPIALVSAGTSDIPVAEECAETLRMLGMRFERVYDVGVAGIHRLLHKRTLLEESSMIIVVAGMEGALPSAVGGLVDVPVIAVPTSCGYGAALSGFTAMFCALTSCASGVVVCNIDNGFGAAFAASRIIRAQERFGVEKKAGV